MEFETKCLSRNKKPNQYGHRASLELPTNLSEIVVKKTQIYQRIHTDEIMFKKGAL